MKPDFLLFHTEGTNHGGDSVCHVIFVPVLNGIRQPAIEYFINPEAYFEFVGSRITRAEVESFPKITEQWPEIQQLIDRFDMLVSSADGNSARGLSATLRRFDIYPPQKAYCNAKAICRRCFDEVCYSLDYLGYKICGRTALEFEPVEVAELWADLVIKGMEKSEAGTWEQFFAEAKIEPGCFSADNFKPSKCIRDYSKRKFTAFNPDNVAVDADQSHPFYGMSVVFTGKLVNFKRDDARAMVVGVGGEAPERLTMSTDYLVVGAQDLRVVGEKGMSGKMKNAAQYREKGAPIEIIDENDFLEMMGSRVDEFVHGKMEEFMDKMIAEHKREIALWKAKNQEQ